MNCFNHRGKPAIGLCKSCAKALCEDCLTEVPYGLACKGSCEDRVNMINGILDRNAKVMKTVRLQTIRTGLFGVLMGIGFLVFAVWAHIQSEDSFLMFLFGFMGVLFLISGILSLSRKAQYPKTDEQKS
jgi:hypothetical protein